MGDQRPLFRRYGSDEEGVHAFVKVDEQSAESPGRRGGFLAAFIISAIGLGLISWMLRASAPVSETAYHAPRATPSVWPWVFGILVGFIGLAFIVVQCVVAYQDRGDYWLLRLGRAGIRSGSRVVRFGARSIRFVWLRSKPTLILTTQTITAFAARSLRGLRRWKGRYYVPNSVPEQNRSAVSARSLRGSSKNAETMQRLSKELRQFQDKTDEELADKALFVRSLAGDRADLLRGQELKVETKQVKSN